MIPAVLLARLAVDVSLQGQGIGGVLVSHAIRVAETVSEIVGARLVVVDAIDSTATSFYEHYRFTVIDRTGTGARSAGVIKHLV